MRVSWEQLFSDLAVCQECALGRTRNNVVAGEGNFHARLMFIGEGPGAEEDAQGRPFVGAAGKLLDKMIGAMGLARGEVYIANIVKCRPPNNRAPLPEEARACLPYLRAQVALIHPQVIVCLGSTAARHVIGEDVRIRRDHGKWFERKEYLFMPTYHPAALLRDETQKKDAWEDLKKVIEKLGELSK